VKLVEKGEAEATENSNWLAAGNCRYTPTPGG